MSSYVMLLFIRSKSYWDIFDLCGIKKERLYAWRQHNIIFFANKQNMNFEYENEND